MEGPFYNVFAPLSSHIRTAYPAAACRTWKAGSHRAGRKFFQWGKKELCLLSRALSVTGLPHPPKIHPAPLKSPSASSPALPAKIEWPTAAAAAVVVPDAAVERPLVVEDAAAAPVDGRRRD